MVNRNIFLAAAALAVLAACAHAQPRLAGTAGGGGQAGLDRLVEACRTEARLTPHRTGRTRDEFIYNAHVRKMTAACRSLADGVRSGNAFMQEKVNCVAEARQGDLLMIHEARFRRHVARQLNICDSLAALGQSGGAFQNPWRVYAAMRR